MGAQLCRKNRHGTGTTMVVSLKQSKTHAMTIILWVWQERAGARIQASTILSLVKSCVSTLQTELASHMCIRISLFKKREQGARGGGSITPWVASSCYVQTLMQVLQLVAPLLRRP